VQHGVARVGRKSCRCPLSKLSCFAYVAHAAPLSVADYLGNVPWREDDAAKAWYARMKSENLSYEASWAYRRLRLHWQSGPSPCAATSLLLPSVKYDIIGIWAAVAIPR
jgi:hypothetical protein